MQVKKFEAPTIQEALETIKRELGPEAVILQTRKNRKGFGLMSRGSVEVTVAVSDRSVLKKKTLEKKLPKDVVEKVKNMQAGQQADVYDQYLERQLEKAAKVREDVRTPARKSSQITRTRYIDINENTTVEKGPLEIKQTQEDPVMKQEINRLKEMVGELRSAQEQLNQGVALQGVAQRASFSSPGIQDVFEQLLLSGVDKKYAFTLIKQVAFALGNNEKINTDQALDQLASEIMENMSVVSVLDQGSEPAIIALVGPTGVGKTTTLAKIASDAAINRGLKVGLINIDNYKIAAFDQLATYAKILKTPFRSVSTSDDLRMAIQDFRSMDLILIDTTGRSQRDTESLKEMLDLLRSVPNIRTELVLAATTRNSELMDMGKRFSVFKPEGLVISKLDEALLFGGIYNVAHALKIPLAYFTTGQRVPEDIEEATLERVAALILSI